MNLTRAYLSLLVTASMFLAGCATTSTTSTEAASEQNVLRVGIAPELPPLAFKSGSDYVGIEPELAQAQAAVARRPSMAYDEKPQFVDMKDDRERLLDIQESIERIDRYAFRGKDLPELKKKISKILES